MVSPRRSLPAVAIALAVAAFGTACGGGGGGGGGGGTGPTPPTANISFTAASAPSANAIVLVSGGASADELQLQLTARAVGDLYGLACDITFPAALRFVSAAEGSVLSAAGSVPTQMSVIENPPGRLVIGHSRLGLVDGLANADGVLLTLRFQANAAGSGAVSFLDPVARDDRGQALAVQWAAGSVTVVR